MKKIITSESVAAGHPDKVCDQISDAILDAYLKEDPNAHVAVECMAAFDTLYISGEVTSKARVNYENVARETIKRIGYDDPEYGFKYDDISVFVKVHEQSSDIDMGVSLKDDIGAGDQGIMYGFACDETEAFLPLPYYLSSQMMRRLDEIKKDYDFLGPDGKGEVSVEYEDGKPVRIAAIVLSNQHRAHVELEDVRKLLKEEVIDKVMPAKLMKEDTEIFINPTGRFVIGGPFGDTGLTGRKIIVDTYGGAAPHGGGAFSGKDPSKVDRSAAYYLRYVAKNLVAAGFASSVTLQAGYCIGRPLPLSLNITMTDAKVSEETALKAINENFDFSVRNIIEELDLRSAHYSELAAYGHFGRETSSFEKTDKAESLKKYL
ncbi:MAG: methionine adenosyltransferase [Erysipelotrichaceae bacterium]|nr:methionine adenosyltransferase [Erysipelotrichaceae bacterium]